MHSQFTIYFANEHWIYSLLRGFTINSLYFSHIHFESIRIFYLLRECALNSPSISRLYIEFTLFFANSLSIHYISRRFTLNSLRIFYLLRECTLQSLFVSNNKYWSIFFREFTMDLLFFGCFTINLLSFLRF